MKIIYKILIFISLFSVCLTMNAQTSEGDEKKTSKPKSKGVRANRRITADIRGVVNMSDMDIEGGNSNKKTHLGFGIGGLVNLKFYKDFQFQTGFFITRKGMKKEQLDYYEDYVTGIEYLVDRRENVDASYIQMPFNLGYEHFFNSEFAVNINGGIYAAHGFKGTSNVKGSVVLYRDPTNVHENLNTGNYNTFGNNRLKRFDYGVGINAGIVYDIYVLSVGYEQGLANISNSNAQAGDVKNKNTYISLGFRF